MVSFSAREEGEVFASGAIRTVASPEIIAPEQELIPRELLRIIKSTQVGSFSLDERFLPGISRLSTQAEIIEIPDHAKTREASAHGVRFGQMLLHSDDEGEYSLLVAVKPFDYEKHAAQQYAVSSYFSSGGVPGINTFRPLGIYRFESGKPSVLLHYRHPVRSMDTIIHNPELINDRAFTSKAMGRAAIALATLHSERWLHGDAQAKNFAWEILKPVTDVFLNDVETMQPFPRFDGVIDQSAATEVVERDIETAAGSFYYLQDRGSDLPYDYERRINEDFGQVYVDKQKAKDDGITLPDFDRVAAIVNQQANYS